MTKLEREEFESRLQNLNEEWKKAEKKLTEERELLRGGISSCMKQLEIMEQAKEAAKGVDELLSEVNTLRADDLDSAESKTEVSELK